MTSPPRGRSGSGPATIGDVARAAGVSTATVSFVLNGRAEGRVSLTTQNRVREVAERLGYVRNLQAGALRTGRGPLVILQMDGDVGAVAPRVRLLAALTRELGGAGYTVAVNNAGPATEADVVRRWLELRPAAVVMIAASVSTAAVDRVRDAGIVVVAVDPRAWDVAPTIVLDDSALGHAALAHLAGRGVDAPSLLMPWGPEDPGFHTRRAEGLREHLPPLDVIWLESTPLAAARLAAQLDTAGLPSGVLATDDTLAGLLLTALADRGVDVAARLPLVGVGDETFCDLLRPRLTSVAVDLLAGSHLFARAVLDALEGRWEGDTVRICWEGTVVVRDT